MQRSVSADRRVCNLRTNLAMPVQLISTLRFVNHNLLTAKLLAVILPRRDVFDPVFISCSFNAVSFTRQLEALGYTKGLFGSMVLTRHIECLYAN